MVHVSKGGRSVPQLEELLGNDVDQWLSVVSSELSSIGVEEVGGSGAADDLHIVLFDWLVSESHHLFLGEGGPAVTHLLKISFDSG